MIGADLAALVEANAWTFGPVATALEVLRLTRRRSSSPEPLDFWEQLLGQCPRMVPLGYWRSAYRSGWTLDALAKDCYRRLGIVARALTEGLADSGRVLVVGHDREVETVWELDPRQRTWRYLLLAGPLGATAPGAFTAHYARRGNALFAPPFAFSELEAALDWADAVLLTGLPLHRQNLLGPPQLRAVLATARDQTDSVLLSVVNERRLTLGEGAPRRYVEDLRPYLWQMSITHVVSEWQEAAAESTLGWLPLPADELRTRCSEEFAPR